MFAMTCLAAACTSWSTTNAAPGEVIQENPQSVRVTRTDRSVLVIQQPTVRNDSIVGFADEGTTPVAVATADVERVETRKVSAKRTAGLGLGIGAGVIAVLGILTAIAFAAFLGGIQ
ncbi:hypothetical protein BH20GEM2_BH20GEM2_20380 [soil metagenome]